MSQSQTLTTVLFDYGGVLATEGFHEGLKALALRFGLDPALLRRLGADAVYASGYVIGRGTETDFWARLCQLSGLPPYRPEYTEEILDRFVLRPEMIAAVNRLRQRGLTVAILSDQTDWLDRLDRRDGFFPAFDRVFNSYYLGRGKRDPALFLQVAETLGARPGEILFIDDNAGHIGRARRKGLRAHQFTTTARCLAHLEGLFSLPLSC